MTKITFKTDDKALTKYAVGDWVMLRDFDGEETLHVIAQTAKGMVNIIAIESDDANRNADPIEWDTDGGSYQALSQSVIDFFCRGGYTIRKVDVEIIVS